MTARGARRALSIACLALVACGGAAAPRPTTGTSVFAIQLEQRLSRYFRFIEAAVALDGTRVFDRAWTEEAPASLTAFHGTLASGRHDLRVYAVLRSRASPWGIFSMSYSAYRFTLRSTHRFDLAPRESRTLRVVVGERGTITTPIEERPVVLYVWSR